MNIIIQGLDTSFHAIAAQQLFGNENTLVYRPTFQKVFHALHENQGDTAVVAIENSLYGSINEVYDLLLKYNFTITGETYQQVGLHLLAPSNSRIEDITDVYSQAPALAESEEYLDQHLPHADRHEHTDTALAAKDVAEWKDPKNAAIASIAAAEKYHLSILAKNIETHPENYTRFISLAKSPTKNSLANKTSLTFSTKDVPGSLYSALGVFAKKEINLTKLESRPIIGRAWKYMYYIDINTVPDESLLKELSLHANDIRILGSYMSGILQKS